MFLEDIDDGVDYFTPDGHLIRIEVSSAFGGLNFKFDFIDYFFLLSFLLSSFLFFWFLLNTESISGFKEESYLIFGFSDEMLSCCGGCLFICIFVLLY